VSETDHSTKPPRVKSGRWIVVGMFAFGIFMVGLLWILFEMHTRPFRDVTEALHNAFPDSRPLVQGGKDNKQPGEPSIFRVVLTVEFDPVSEEQQFQETIRSIQAICEQHHDLSPFSRMEIHLIRSFPEKAAIKRQTVIELQSNTDQTDFQPSESNPASLSAVR